MSVNKYYNEVINETDKQERMKIFNDYNSNVEYINDNLVKLYSSNFENSDEKPVYNIGITFYHNSNLNRFKFLIDSLINKPSFIIGKDNNPFNFKNFCSSINIESESSTTSYELLYAKWQYANINKFDDSYIKLNDDDIKKYTSNINNYKPNFENDILLNEYNFHYYLYFDKFYSPDEYILGYTKKGLSINHINKSYKQYIDELNEPFNETFNDTDYKSRVYNLIQDLDDDLKALYLKTLLDKGDYIIDKMCDIYERFNDYIINIINTLPNCLDLIGQIFNYIKASTYVIRNPIELYYVIKYIHKLIISNNSDWINVISQLSQTDIKDINDVIYVAEHFILPPNIKYNIGLLTNRIDSKKYMILLNRKIDKALWNLDFFLYDQILMYMITNDMGKDKNLNNNICIDFNKSSFQIYRSDYIIIDNIRCYKQNIINTVKCEYIKNINLHFIEDGVDNSGENNMYIDNQRQLHEYIKEIKNKNIFKNVYAYGSLKHTSVMTSRMLFYKMTAGEYSIIMDDDDIAVNGGDMYYNLFEYTYKNYHDYRYKTPYIWYGMGKNSSFLCGFWSMVYLPNSHNILQTINEMAGEDNRSMNSTPNLTDNIFKGEVMEYMWPSNQGYLNKPHICDEDKEDLMNNLYYQNIRGFNITTKLNKHSYNNLIKVDLKNNLNTYDNNSLKEIYYTGSAAYKYKYDEIIEIKNIDGMDIYTSKYKNTNYEFMTTRPSLPSFGLYPRKFYLYKNKLYSIINFINNHIKEHINENENIKKAYETFEEYISFWGKEISVNDINKQYKYYDENVSKKDLNRDPSSKQIKLYDYLYHFFRNSESVPIVEYKVDEKKIKQAKFAAINIKQALKSDNYNKDILNSMKNVFGDILNIKSIPSDISDKLNEKYIEVIEKIINNNDEGEVNWYKLNIDDIKYINRLYSHTTVYIQKTFKKFITSLSDCKDLGEEWETHYVIEFNEDNDIVKNIKDFGVWNILKDRILAYEPIISEYCEDYYGYNMQNIYVSIYTDIVNIKIEKIYKLMKNVLKEKYNANIDEIFIYYYIQHYEYKNNYIDICEFLNEKLESMMSKYIDDGVFNECNIDDLKKFNIILDDYKENDNINAYNSYFNRDIYENRFDNNDYSRIYGERKSNYVLGGDDKIMKNISWLNILLIILIVILVILVVIKFKNRLINIFRN